MNSDGIEEGKKRQRVGKLVFTHFAGLFILLEAQSRVMWPLIIIGKFATDSKIAWVAKGRNGST